MMMMTNDYHPMDDRVANDHIDAGQMINERLAE